MKYNCDLEGSCPNDIHTDQHWEAGHRAGMLDAAEIADEHTRPARADEEQHRPARTREAECISAAIRAKAEGRKP